MSDDAVKDMPISGINGTEFLENLAETLAQSLTFEGHGPLTADERSAFKWGFRHGAHHIHGLLAAAAIEGKVPFEIIENMIHEATEAWDIGVAVRVLKAPNPDAPPSPTKH